MMEKIISRKRITKFFFLAVCFLIAGIIRPGKIWPQEIDTKSAERMSADSSAALASFDDSVRESRVEMRKYCAITQEIMKNPDSEKMDTALKHIRHARALWENVQKEYQDNPPGGYQKDNLFKSRLSEIHSKMEEMENELLMDSPQESFKACSYACGLFVKMHEENGLVYMADRLFHLRKFGKTMKEAAAAKGLPAAREMLPELLHQRDRILLTAHPHFHENNQQQEFQSALKSMTASIDDVAITTIKKDLQGLESVMNELISQINKAYALAL